MKDKMAVFFSGRRCSGWITALLCAAVLLGSIPEAAAERSVNLAPLHYGDEAFSLHMDDIPNTVTLDGVEYEFDDDNVFAFQEALTIYGGKTRSVYEMTLPQKHWENADPQTAMKLGTVTFTPEVPVTVVSGDGNRVSGEYILSDPVVLTDLYRETVTLPRDADGTMYLVDKIYLYSYTVDGVTTYHAASVYFDYENYTAGHWGPAAAADTEPAVTAVPKPAETEAQKPAETEAPKTAEAEGSEEKQETAFPWLYVAACAGVILLAGFIILQKKRKHKAAAPEAVVEQEALKTSLPKDPELAELTRRFGELTAKIQAAVDKDPTKAPKVRKFFNYYVPTAGKLAEYAVHAESSGVSEEEMNKIRGRCRHGLDMACTAAQKQLDSLYSNVAMDADAEIAVMERMLKIDGFADSDFLTERKNGE